MNSDKALIKKLHIMIKEAERARDELTGNSSEGEIMAINAHISRMKGTIELLTTGKL